MIEKKIEKYLDNNIIYIYKNDKNGMMKKLGINPNNLYSLGKKIKIDKQKFKFKKGGVSRRELELLNIRTKYKLPDNDNKTRINDYINYFTSKLKDIHEDIVGIHIPIIINGIRYYIELTAKENKKIIIAIKEDRRHINELVHYSCFVGSFVHITFILNNKHYKIYHKINPIRYDRWFGVYNIINDIKHDFFDNIRYIHESFYDNTIKNNWFYDIYSHRNFLDIIRLFDYNLFLLKKTIDYISSTPTIINL